MSIECEQEKQFTSSIFMFDESSWRMIEWPEVGEELMPPGGVDVEIQVMPDGSRRVHAEKV